MKKAWYNVILSSIIMILVSYNSYAQKVYQYEGDNLWEYTIGSEFTAASNNTLPFWFRSVKYGAVPLNGLSAALTGTITKNYDGTSPGFIDWCAGLQVRGITGGRSYFTLIEAYVKAKASVFEISAGRMKDMTGIVDSSLSSGAFSMSGNALGIPKIKFAMPDYLTIPIFDKLFAFKVDYQCGLLGEQDLRYDKYAARVATYYQENSIYVRLGKPNWRLKLFGGINHNVESGNDRAVLGPGYTLSKLKSFIYAGIGKTYNTIQTTGNFNDYNSLTSKVGNHIGSVDIAFQYEFDNVRMLGYRQNLYDVGALSRLANIADGINGISLTNKSYEDYHTCWSKILFEFVYTKDQAGLVTSVPTNSGDEDYYNNYIYNSGWSYKGQNLGNIFLTTRQYTRSNLVTSPVDHFINNRVVAFNTAVQGNINKFNMLLRLSYSKNFGTFGTSSEGNNLEYYKKHIQNPYGIFVPVKQFSGYIDVNKNFDKGLSVGAAIGADIGGLYYNTVGLQITIKKALN